MELGIDDLGYIQQPNGAFTLHYFYNGEIDHQQLKELIQSAGYPIDKIVAHKTPLPRDARHKSKLQINELYD